MKSFAAVTIALFAAAGCSSSNKDTTSTILIGVNVEETGACGNLSQTFINSVDLAVKDINAAGGVLGKKLSYQIKDAATDPNVTAANVTAFAAAGAVGLVGPICSGDCFAAVPVIKQHSLLTVGSGSNPNLTTADSGGYFFRSFPSDAIQGVKLADYAAKQGWTNVTVFYENTTYGSGLDATFKANFTGTVNDIEYSDTATSFDSNVTAGLATHPNALFFFGYPQQVASLIQAAQSQNFTGPLVGSDATADPSLPKDAAGADFSKWVGSEAGLYQYPLLTSFITHYTAAYGTAPTTAWATAYDDTIAIALAIEAAGTSTNPNAILAAFRAVTSTSTGTAVDYTTLSNALTLAKAKTPINYQGVTSPFDFNPNSGDLTFASSSYVLWNFDANGNVNIISSL